MTSRVQRLAEAGLIQPPKWLPNNVHYEAITGSVSYGVSNDMSDCDIVGFAIPPKEVIFPHLKGEIQGFGRQIQRFDQFQKHHIDGKQVEGNADSYDVSVYNIVKFFQLCMENNPNMVDALFVPERCVLHITTVGQMVRDERRIFLHKGSWHKFRGYAHSQLHKMKRSKPTGKRKETVEKYGYDVKFAYHVVRLLDECEQILEKGDLDLTRSREVLKAIRRGDWTQNQVADYFEENEKRLQKLYAESDLQHSPDEEKIKDLLVRCLSAHYGSLEGCVSTQGRAEQAINEIEGILHRFRTVR